jgi:putative Mg2+ transporter-C (MgtC) family protein
MGSPDHGMPLYPTWEEIAIRLALSVVAGAIIGFNREATGRAAGLRTTLLVCLAASVAMVLANLLLPLEGKTAESFARVDVMRLPLGILTGVGFIGGGAILRRDNLITGVTTAATLWTVSVIGLCFGAGEIELGIAATVASAVILWLLKWIDVRMPRDQTAILCITTEGGAGALQDVRGAIAATGVTARLAGQTRLRDPERTVTRLEVRWHGRQNADPPFDVVALLDRAPHISAAEWEAVRAD